MVKSCYIFATHSILDILQGLEYTSGGDLPLFLSPFRETQEEECNPVIVVRNFKGAKYCILEIFH